MRLSTSLRHGLGYIAILISGTSVSHALEQGSYFVIDLVESAETQPAPGRLAVPQAVLAASVAEEAPSFSLEKRSEFEIDYSEGLQTSGNSTFEFSTPVETTEQPKSTNFSTSTFDFGSSNTVFGD